MGRLLEELRRDFPEDQGSPESVGRILNRIIERIDEVDDRLDRLYRMLEIDPKKK